MTILLTFGQYASSQQQQIAVGEDPEDAMEVALEASLEDGQRGEIQEVVVANGYAYGIWIVGESAGVYVAKDLVGEDDPERWGVTCATGGVFNPQELANQCGVPINTATELYHQLIE
ncbi:MAG: hypothetical protein AAFW84_09840 [Cyanobacteria bacterium J06635_15]